MSSTEIPKVTHYSDGRVVREVTDQESSLATSHQGAPSYAASSTSKTAPVDLAQHHRHRQVGRKATHAESEARVQRAYQLLTECKTRPTIIQIFAADYGVTESMVDKYIKRARAQIEKDWAIDRKEWMALALSKLERMAELSVDTRQIAAGIGAVGLQAKLLRVTEGNN